MRFNKTNTDDAFGEMLDESNSKSLGDVTALVGKEVNAYSGQYAAGGAYCLIRDEDGRIKGQIMACAIITEEKVRKLKHKIAIRKGDTLHCISVAAPT